MAFLSYNNAFLEKKNQGIFSLKKIRQFPFPLDSKRRVHLLWIKYMLPELHIPVSQLAWRGGGVVQTYLHISAMRGTTARQYATAILHLLISFRKRCPLKKHCLSLPPKMLIDHQVYQHRRDERASLPSWILGDERRKIIHLDTNTRLGKRNPQVREGTSRARQAQNARRWAVLSN